MLQCTRGRPEPRFLPHAVSRRRGSARRCYITERKTLVRSSLFVKAQQTRTRDVDDDYDRLYADRPVEF